MDSSHVSTHDTQPGFHHDPAGKWLQRYGVAVFKEMLFLFRHEVVSNSSDPMNYSPPGPFVYWISKARKLEWLSFPSPEDLTDPRIEPASPASPAVAGKILYHWATREALKEAIPVKWTNSDNFRESLYYTKWNLYESCVFLLT